MSDQPTPTTLGDIGDVKPGDPADAAPPMDLPVPGSGTTTITGTIGGPSTSSDLPPDAGPPAAPEGSDIEPDADDTPAPPDLPVPDVVEPPVDGTLSVADVPAEQTIIGTNSADGKPTVVDPTFRDAAPDAGTVEKRLVDAATAANENLTDAERTSGEVTVNSRGGDLGRVDAEHIGMGTALEYRPRETHRVMRVDHAFTVDGEDGESGDYLVEDPDGHRHKLTATELNEHFIAI